MSLTTYRPEHASADNAAREADADARNQEAAWARDRQEAADRLAEALEAVLSLACLQTDEPAAAQLDAELALAEWRNLP